MDETRDIYRTILLNPDLASATGARLYPLWKSSG